MNFLAIKLQDDELQTIKVQIERQVNYWQNTWQFTDLNELPDYVRSLIKLYQHIQYLNQIAEDKAVLDNVEVVRVELTDKPLLIVKK